MLSLAKTSRADARAAPMSRRMMTMTAKPAGHAPATSLQPGRFGVLQRKCACGGDCPRCRDEAAQKKIVGLQTKLRVNEPGDAYEQEADRVADEVMAKPSPPDVSSAPPRIQRFSAQSSGQMGVAPASVDRAFADAGGPLEPALRQDMEQRFGRDFSRVRVHSDEAADAAARSIDARAFTLGGDIAFAPGEYAPGTAEGRRLLAHELTHVVQQADTSTPSHAMRKAHPGCDKRTTGEDDASAHLDLAQAEALKITTDARKAFPHMTPATVRMADRHFHCPSSSDIGAVMSTFAAIERMIPLLGVRCVSASDPQCRYAPGAKLFQPGNILQLCPPSSYTSSYGGVFEEFDLTGDFIWGAGVSAGLAPYCRGATVCSYDFTIIASDMVKQADAYRDFVLEHAGYPEWSIRTIPCAPYGTGTYVSVPPNLVNPREIRPVTGYEPAPPPGSRVVEVFKDRAGKRFIYIEHPYAEVYLPNEPKRYYFPRWHPLYSD